MRTYASIVRHSMSVLLTAPRQSTRPSRATSTVALSSPPFTTS